MRPLLVPSMLLVVAVTVPMNAYAASKTIRWIGASIPAQLEGYKKIFADFTKDKGIKINAGASLAI